MTIPIDVEVGASALGAAEVTIATLAAFAPKIDVYVDATADPLLLDSVWTVYAVPGAGGTATPLASATLRNIGAGLRLLAGVDGAGDTVVLKARSVRGVTAAVTAALIGWDPNAQTTNVTDKLSAVLGGGVASGVVNQVVATGLAWHPSVDAFVSIAPASVAGSRWAIRAVIAGFSAPVEVGQAIYVGGGNQKIVSVEGGASSWEIVVSTPQGAIGASAASIVGRSRAGAVPVAAGGLSLVGAYAQRTAIAGAAPVTGTRYGNTDRFGGVAIWTGAAWQPELTPGILGTAPPPANDAGWVDINWSGAGATSLVQQGDAIFLSDFGGFAAAENVRGVVRALPAPPWTVEVAFLPTIIQANNSMAIGLLLRESGSGKMKRFAAFSAAGAIAITEQDLNSATSAAAGSLFAISSAYEPNLMWFTIINTGATGAGNYQFLQSQDGRNYQPALGTQGNNVFLVADQVGIGVQGYGTAGAGLWLGHFKVTTP